MAEINHRWTLWTSLLQQVPQVVNLFWDIGGAGAGAELWGVDGGKKWKTSGELWHNYDVTQREDLWLMCMRCLHTPNYLNFWWFKSWFLLWNHSVLLFERDVKSLCVWLHLFYSLNISSSSQKLGSIMTLQTVSQNYEDVLDSGNTFGFIILCLLLPSTMPLEKWKIICLCSSA